MQFANTTTRYGAVPQVLHWLTAIFVICGFLLGQFGDDLPKGGAREAGLFIHMTLGQGVVVLLVARLFWRVANPPPPPPEPTRLGRLVVWAAKLSHFSLRCCSWCRFSASSFSSSAATPCRFSAFGNFSRRGRPTATSPKLFSDFTAGLPTRY
jgi:cytochrome b561